MTRLPYLLPWVRVLLLIRSITSTTWGHEARPQVKPVHRRALEIRRQLRVTGGRTRVLGRRLLPVQRAAWAAVGRRGDNEHL
jgi:hypothetical protein